MTLEHRVEIIFDAIDRRIAQHTDSGEDEEELARGHKIDPG